MTLADVQKAKKAATDEAAGCVMAMFCTVLRDKEGDTTEDFFELRGKKIGDCAVYGGGTAQHARV